MQKPKILIGFFCPRAKLILHFWLEWRRCICALDTREIQLLHFSQKLHRSCTAISQLLKLHRWWFDKEISRWNCRKFFSLNSRKIYKACKNAFHCFCKCTTWSTYNKHSRIHDTMGVSLLGILQLQWGGGHHFVLFSMLIMFGSGGRWARWFSWCRLQSKKIHSASNIKWFSGKDLCVSPKKEMQDIHFPDEIFLNFKCWWRICNEG